MKYINEVARQEHIERRIKMAKISLVAARVNAGLTQEKMAEKLGVSRQTVHAWETGKAEMKTAYFIAFCAITGFTTEDIFLPIDFTDSEDK